MTKAEQETAVNASKAVSQLLSMPPSERDADWNANFSGAVVKAAFEVGKPDFFQGPGGAGYYRYQIPDEGEREVTIIGRSLDGIVEAYSGAAIFHTGDEPVYVLSPGDMVSLKLFELTDVQMGGVWDKPAVGFTVEEETQIQVGVPNEKFLPELVRRSLRFVLQNAANIEQPKVLCFKFDDPEKATNLVFNLFPEDYEPEQYKGLCELVLHFMPRHLRRRTVFVSNTVFAESAFTPL